MHRSITGLEKYANGRRVTRKNGRFAKAEAAVYICTNCGGVNLPTIGQRDKSGFVNPLDFGKKPALCNKCGYNLHESRPASAGLNDYMAIG